MIPSPTRSRRIKAARLAARIVSAGDDLDRRLAARRQGREERNARSRKSAATKRRDAFVRDALRNAMVSF